MALVFWRKTLDTGRDRQDQSVAVDEQNPLPVQLRKVEDADPSEILIANQYLPPQAGETRFIGPIQIPGIGTASPYTDGDAFGTLILFPGCFRAEKCSGVVSSALFYDLDDEGVNKNLVLFARSVTATTDNNAFDPSDADLLACRGVVAITTWYNWNSSQMGEIRDLNLRVQSDSPNLYGLIVTRGADNIAAGSLPYIAITVIPD